MNTNGFDNNLTAYDVNTIQDYQLLKDILEDEVDSKFYLDDKYIERIKNRKATQKPLERVLLDENKSHCLTAR